jgi:protein-disulfide isomerase
MAKEEKKSSGMPVAIIVGVLVLVVVGGFLYYRSSATPQSNNNTKANTGPNPVARPTINPNAPPGAVPPNAMGAPTAAVTVEEFADYQCGSCAATYPVMKDVLKAYNGNPNFRFVFRNFPLQMHDKAYDAAVMAEAAGLQNPAKLWLMQEQLFTNQQNWALPSVDNKKLWNEYAQKVGLDVDKLNADAAGMQAKSRVDLDLARGRAIGIGSTPTVIVNNKIIPYQEVTLAGMKRIIDAELAAANQPQQQQQQAPVNAQPANVQPAPANK